VAVGLLVYAAVLWLLKVPELQTIIQRVKCKLAENG